MNTRQTIEERLWDYIDGVSPADEIAIIKKLLQDDEEWKNVYMELMDMHELMQSSELEQPSLRFTKNVMDKISAYHNISVKKYINKKIIWSIGAFFIIFIAGLLIYGFAQVDWSLTTKSKFPFDMGKFDFSMIFNNTFIYIFMMINVVLGLMLLDRFLAGKKMNYNVGK